MTLPSRLPGLSREVTDLAWAPRLSPNPVGQALSEAHTQENAMGGDGEPSLPSLAPALGSPRA
jgi:hypothetical protein